MDLQLNRVVSGPRRVGYQKLNGDGPMSSSRLVRTQFEEGQAKGVEILCSCLNWTPVWCGIDRVTLWPQHPSTPALIALEVRGRSGLSISFGLLFFVWTI